MIVKTQTKNLGFTLMELIITMGIIGMLASVTLTSFSQGNQSRSVALGADIFTSAFRTIQNYSQFPRPIPGSTCTPEQTASEYRLYFDTNVSSTATLLAYDKCSSPPATLQTFSLPKNVKIRQANGMSLDGVGIGALGGTLEFKFLPPFAKMTASRNGGAYVPFSQAVIVVESANNHNVNETITISGISGRVDRQ